MLAGVLALLASCLPAPGLGADCDERAAALEVHLGALAASELADKAWLALSRTFLLLGQKELAVSALRHLSRGHGPQAEDAQLNLMVLYRALGDRGAALKECRRFLKRYPDHRDKEHLNSRPDSLRWPGPHRSPRSLRPGSTWA